MPSDDAYAGTADLSTLASDKNALDFIVRMILGELATATLVKVVAVYPSDDSLVTAGTVDVQPLVNMLDGSGNAIPHAQLHKLPFFRLQGGTNAVQIDPKAGDIGLAVFASRDISSVVANKGQANPGSFRQFDMADGLYLGGFLNGAPTQYLRFFSGGVQLVSPTKVTLQAPAAVIGNSGGTLGFFGAAGVSKATITGALNSVSDANAKAVLKSIIALLTGYDLGTDGTT